MRKITPKKNQDPEAKTQERPTGHIVTVLLQDYFHRGVFKQVIGEKQWSRFETRLDKNVDDTLALLDRFKVKATFFTLGWIAEQNPEIIKRIVSEDHEIASAGYWACSVREMTPSQFREDLRRSHRALEEAGANRIIGYRSAYQWMRRKDFWALDILAEEGYRYDASFRPALYGFTNNASRRYAHEHPTVSGKIWEFPTSTHSFWGFNLPIAGGGYLRQFPHRLMFSFYKSWCEKTDAPFVLYFHPWELDKQQPQITAVGRLSKIKQYRNLGKMRWVLPEYFEKGAFQTVSQFLGIPLEYPNEKELKYRRAIRINLKKENLKPYTLNPIPVPVTVVIPCYNEFASLPYLEKALAELKLRGNEKYRFKFLFVNDCSTDDTTSRLQEVFGIYRDCRIIRHAKNMGVAAAIQTGIRKADTEIVATMDADCSYDPLELLKMLDQIDENIDMVTASPYHRKGIVLGVPKWRLFLSKTLSQMYHLLLSHKLATYTSCFRVCRRSALLELETKYGDFRGIIELLARLDIQGGSIIEYPTTLQSRIFGHSKMKIIKTILGHLELIIDLIKVMRIKPITSELGSNKRITR